MLKIEIERLGANGLTVGFEIKKGAIQISLSGTCDRESLPHLEPFLRDLHEEAQRLGVKQVIIDCESLYFMNSASIKCFVTWIAKLKPMLPNQRYTVEFRINKRLAWQQRTLSAITRFAPEIARLA